MALESGDYAAARWYWERILPVAAPPGQPQTWPGYPDTKLDLAMVRARLVLASILEGATARAREELAELVRLHPRRTGRLGGREVNFAEALGELLPRAPPGRIRPVSPDWPTFAGAPTRNKIAPRAIDVAEWAGRVASAAVRRTRWPRTGGRTSPGDSANGLSYFPLLLGDRVFFNDQREIAAVRLSDGRPLWGESTPTIYRDPMDGAAGASIAPPRHVGRRRGSR